MTLARWFFYLYFSLAAGMFVAGVIGWFFRGALPADGLALWLVCAGFIALALVFGQREHFGERIRVLRWTLLCVTATPLALAGYLGGLTVLN